MKYIRTKKDTIRTTKNTGHHRSLAAKSEVKSAGRFTTKSGSVNTYSKSWGFNIPPKKGDAKLIQKHLKKHG